MYDVWVRELQRLVQVTGGVVIAAGVGFGVLRFVGDVPPAQDLEAALGATAFGAVIAAPGVLALLALRDRPALLVPAAAVLIPLSFLSFALVTLPLLIPAFLLMRAYLRAAHTGSGWRAALTTVVVLTLLVAALAALFAHEDPREYVTETTHYGTSDIVTYGESALSLALTVTAIGAGWRLAAPRGRDRAVPSRRIAL